MMSPEVIIFLPPRRGKKFLLGTFDSNGTCGVSLGTNRHVFSGLFQQRNQTVHLGHRVLEASSDLPPSGWR